MSVLWKTMSLLKDQFSPDLIDCAHKCLADKQCKAFNLRREAVARNSTVSLRMYWNMILKEVGKVGCFINQHRCDRYAMNSTCLCCLYIWTQGRRSHGSSGGNCPRCPNSAGATGCPFYQNCTSKFVRSSQELEFITIFKQCLSNLCLIFNHLL
jgi:hypothetical protein